MLVEFDALNHLRHFHSSSVIVLVGGCYDLIHCGHVQFLEKCRGLGDILVVAVSTDKRVKQRKGYRRPIIGQDDRAFMLSSLKCVSYALIAPEPVVGQPPPTVAIIDSLQPDIFATNDGRSDEYAKGLEFKGTRVINVPPVPWTSTTALIDRIVGRYG